MLQLESSCLLLYLTYVTYITGSDGKTIRKMIKKEVNAFVKNGRQLFTNNEIYLEQETKQVIDVKHRGKRVKLSQER